MYIVDCKCAHRNSMFQVLFAAQQDRISALLLFLFSFFIGEFFFLFVFVSNSVKLIPKQNHANRRVEIYVLCRYGGSKTISTNNIQTQTEFPTAKSISTQWLMNRRSKRDRRKMPASAASRILIFDLSRTFVIDWELLKAHKNELPKSIDNANNSGTILRTPINVQESSERAISILAIRSTRWHIRKNGGKWNHSKFRTQSFASILLSASWMIDCWMIYHAYASHFPQVRFIPSGSFCVHIYYTVIFNQFREGEGYTASAFRLPSHCIRFFREIFLFPRNENNTIFSRVFLGWVKSKALKTIFTQFHWNIMFLFGYVKNAIIIMWFSLCNPFNFVVLYVGEFIKWITFKPYKAMLLEHQTTSNDLNISVYIGFVDKSLIVYFHVWKSIYARPSARQWGKYKTKHSALNLIDIFLHFRIDMSIK